MSNEIGSKIRGLREKLGYSQEYMAAQLDVSQSSYGRLEQLDDRLTISVLKKIAEILKVNIATLIDEKSSKIINQSNNETANAYNVDTLVNSDNNTIESLRKEIEFLKELILKKL